MKKFGLARAATIFYLAAMPVVNHAAEPAERHPGSLIYEQYCGVCHNQPESARSPSLAALKQMTADQLKLVLTEGIMQEQAGILDRRQFAVLIDYLAVKEADSNAWLADWMCGEQDRSVDLTQPVTLARVGVDFESTRHMTAAQAGLSSLQLRDLELAWAIGFPDTNALRSSPVIIGNLMYYSPTPTGRVLAIDVTKPCVKWVYEAGTELRTSMTYGELGASGQSALVFADRRGQVHAIDPETGTTIWKAEGRHSRQAAITGAPQIVGDRIIVPVSGSGVGRGANPQYECCVEHGAVVALNAVTGEQLWTYHTTAEATYTGKTNRLGVKLRGPSGAPVWSTPTIDLARGLVYATTGQNTSLPATDTSDAVLAIDLETGNLRWGFQALANDVWIIGCRDDPAQSTPNCPSPEDSVLKDFDFGAAAILTKNQDGKDILLAGQKSGDVWALDPDTGKLLWNTRLGEGTPLGGIHWGMATDGQRVFAPINDPVSLWALSKSEPGMNALDVTTGKILWRTPTRPDCENGRKERFDQCDRMYGLSAAPLSIDESVVAGSLDGKLYIFDSATGETIFEYDVLKDFETANGFAGKGGSIESQTIAAGAGMIFVGAGYSQFRQAPGNVLLAFKPKGK
ncbi:MAG: PQQ-binding-like beta-propeller repeat protein [Pseudomonadales bacterium]